jgi:glycosyltransferase involved in cell wall biosynthesis
MRILHFIDNLNYGGTETLLMSYIPSLPQYEHFILTITGPNVYSRDAYVYIQLNKNVHFQFLAIVRSVRQLIKENNIDIVHSHSFWTNIISRLSTPKNIKLFNHYHFADYDSRSGKSFVIRMLFLDRLFFHKKLHRIAVSNYIGHVLRMKFKAAKISVLHNFVQSSPLPQTTHSTKTTKILRVVAVGNCNTEKNYDVLLNAFEVLKNDEIYIDVYGGGPKLQHYRTLTQKRGLSKISFKGYCSCVREKISTYDLFVSTSESEAFGIAVLEAIAAGLPILLSDIPAYREIAPLSTPFFNSSDKSDFASKLRFIFNNRFNVNNSEYNVILQKYSPNNFLLGLHLLYTSK